MRRSLETDSRFAPFVGRAGRPAAVNLNEAAHAPQAAILFDKFHVMRHLGDALDKVRKAEYARLSGKDRRFIKGQKYTLLSNRENLTLITAIKTTSASIIQQLRSVRTALGPAKYPFDHATEGLGLADFVIDAIPPNADDVGDAVWRVTAATH